VSLACHAGVVGCGAGGGAVVPGWGLFLAAGDGLHRVTGCGAAVAWTHGSDPQAGRVAQIVGRSGVGAGDFRLRLGREIPDGDPAHTVTALMTARDAVAPGEGCHCGRARVVLVLAVPGEGFDGSAEVMAGRA
jgi:hypothetical protein